MGIRPSCELVMALRDWQGFDKDPRWTLSRDMEDVDTLYGTELQRPADKRDILNYKILRQEGARIEDHITMPDDEYGCNILGYRIDRIPASSALYAIAYLWPEIETSAFIELPLEDISRPRIFGIGAEIASEIIAGAQAADIEDYEHYRQEADRWLTIFNARWYYRGFWQYITSYWGYTRYLLGYCLEMSIKPADFCLGLLWE